MGVSRAIALTAVAVVLLAWPAACVKISPDLPPRTVPYDVNLKDVMELPFDYNNGAFTTVKTAPGCSPEQVSLTYYGAASDGTVSVLVSWATCDAIVDASPSLGDCAGTSKKGTVTGPLSTNGVTSYVLYGPSTGGKYPYGISTQTFWHITWPKSIATGQPSSYIYDYSSRGGAKYASPLLHHVLIRGLQPGAQYDYIIVDNVVSSDASSTQTLSFRARGRSSIWGPNPYQGSFKAPGVYKRRYSASQISASAATPDHFTWPVKPIKGLPQYPFKVAVIGDPGQTYNTTDTLSHVLGSNSDMLFILADFTYADRPDKGGTLPPSCNTAAYALTSGTYQPRWDTWGRLFQPVLSKIPFLHANGNHEIEPQPGFYQPYNTNFTARDVAYNFRYPAAQLGPNTYSRPGPVLPQPGAPKDADSSGTPAPGAYKNLYHADVIPGVATTIWLTSYSPYDVNGFTKSSEQYVWLKNTLENIDRRRTPWLIVNWHAPVYNTYTSHFKENECFRQAYEPLLLQYSVDILFFGHVHAYERTKPVKDYQVDTGSCSPVHITIGDAGNIEGAANTFVDVTPPAYCADPNKLYTFPSYQPQKCIKYNQGTGSGCADSTSCFCYATQPAWSAYREPSFGHGELTFNSPTEAVWKWYRNVDQQAQESDSVTITRDPSCAS